MSTYSKRVRMQCDNCHVTKNLMLSPACTPERDCKGCGVGTMQFLDPFSPTEAEIEGHAKELAQAASSSP